MSDSNWRHYPHIGVAVFALISLGAGHNINHRGQESARNSQQEAGQHYPAAAFEIVARDVPPAANAPESEGKRGEKQSDVSDQPHWSNYADLSAQWAMAIGTFFIVGFTYLGLRVLRETLLEAEAATRAANEAADSARKTNETTREIGQAQVRGYPCLTSFQIAFGNLGDAFDIQLIFEIANSGQSPLRNIRVEATCDLKITSLPGGPSSRWLRQHVVKDPDIHAGMFFHDIPAGQSHKYTLHAGSLDLCNITGQPPDPTKLPTGTKASIIMFAEDVFDGEWTVSFDGAIDLRGSGDQVITTPAKMTAAPIINYKTKESRKEA